MDIFVVVLDLKGAQASAQVKERMKEHFETYYEISQSAFVVASDDVTAEVANSVGIRGDGQIPGATGAVFRASSYSGFTNRALWEWIEKAEER